MLCLCVTTDIAIQGEIQKCKKIITGEAKGAIENNLEFKPNSNLEKEI